MLDLFDFSLNFIIAQCVGVLGYGIVIGATQLKNRNVMLSFEVLGSLVIALQWFILSMPILALLNIAYAGISILGVLRTYHKYGEYLFALSVPLTIFMLALGWGNDIISYLTLLAACLFLLSRYSQNIANVRLYALSSSSCWLVINSLSGSIPGCICNIFYISGHARQLQKHKREILNTSTAQEATA